MEDYLDNIFVSQLVDSNRTSEIRNLFGDNMDSDPDYSPNNDCIFDRTDISHVFDGFSVNHLRIQTNQTH